MATTPNQNPVPSEEYANMRFNAGKLDEFINATVNTYVDRLGITHMTVKGLQAAAVGALLPANNLSDVANVTTARTNLLAAKSGANTDITSITGVAATATALATARTLQTDLTSTIASSFNGTANNTHGVTGTLPIANGGTGGTTAALARTALSLYSQSETISNTYNDTTLATTSWVSPTPVNGWSNNSGAGGRTAYRKMNGLIYIEVNLIGGTQTSGTTLFTLPSGFIPSGNRFAAAVGLPNNATVIYVDVSGNVKLATAAGGSGIVGLLCYSLN